jgi:hypothetical protein
MGGSADAENDVGDRRKSSERDRLRIALRLLRHEGARVFAYSYAPYDATEPWGEGGFRRFTR